MAQSLYRKYFSISPVNNISTFSVSGGVDQISFIIPALPGATLQTRDLVMSGKLLISNAAGAAYTRASVVAGTENVAWDSVNGAQNLISRVDINSAGSNNSLIEQRRQYPLVCKYRRGVLSENDLVVGSYANQQMCSNSSNGARNYLTRQVDTAGCDFAIQLNTGFFADSDQDINLQAANNILVKIYLNDISNSLFSVTPGAGPMTADWNIQLQNVELFGRWNYVSQPSLNNLRMVNFRKINDLMSVLQSQNDTLVNQPMVSSVNKIVAIYQPNATTSNNISKNNTACNQVVGLSQYQLSSNGTLYPYDYEIDINPTIQSLNANTGVGSRQGGSAEQSYMLINSLGGQFPPVHSLVNGKNQARGVEDQISGNNVSSLNVDGIGVDYSYGFSGYTVPMNNSLLQTQVVSSILTNDAIVPPASRNQSATQNYFVEYNSSLTYAGMSVSQ